ncbi:MAG: fasciclin domain-containing protein, partial [Candidatus Planktophila sp.]
NYDTDGTNYDIVTAAVLAVLEAKPNSGVSALTDGNVALTAFIPNDDAFINLVTAWTGVAPASESAAFSAVAQLGIDTIENVLLYHVVPGSTILSPDALKANGTSLATALKGASLAVTVKGTDITLADQDAVAADPKVILSQVDINKGNKQVAHGIDAVLLPVQLISLGSNSLAAVLTAKNSFDSNKSNFDIVTAAVLAVLKAKPASDVAILTDGNFPVTAFIPNDGAFLKLVKALTGKAPKNERAAFNTVAGLGIPTVESILKYHIVQGNAILSPAALKANGAQLMTALDGKVIKVSVNGTKITLADYNKKLKDPVVVLSRVDLNKGNLQVAHGINAVLMPTA